MLTEAMLGGHQRAAAAEGSAVCGKKRGVGGGEAEAGDEEGVGAMARRWKERVKGRREKDAGESNGDRQTSRASARQRGGRVRRGWAG
jgi:hypothetical protein